MQKDPNFMKHSLLVSHVGSTELFIILLINPLSFLVQNEVSSASAICFKVQYDNIVLIVCDTNTTPES